MINSAEIRSISFTVYEKGSDSNGPGGGSGGGSDGTDGGVGTGDRSNVLLWVIEAVLALSAAAAVIITGKRKKK